MFSKDKDIYYFFFYWLILSLIIVFFIIIVGGLTRLTNSGLSITEWELFKGVLPPLNDTSWQYYFNEYKKIPQFKIINNNITLQEFKIIFYWEYFHRILARLIGLFFLIPLIYFYLSKKINKQYIKTCFFIFGLILAQGFMGWYMVQSGLVNNISVSHYRLSIHLITALIIASTIFWLIYNVKEKKNIIFFNFSKKNIPFLVLIFLLFTQIILGAFVSGLDAGLIYQTWPMMGETFIPNDIFTINIKNILNFNNHSLVQFYHRNLAYMITIYILLLGFYIYIKKLTNLYDPLKIIIIFLLIQISLGIFTLVSGLNIYLASAHQISSVLLVFSALNLYYLRTN
jgi:heme a synthase